eukprot:m.188294 g.188294  ORF g.188294 m.188294 type:complete len:301 (-) comp24821_c0_seq1:270-1172(-)
MDIVQTVANPRIVALCAGLRHHLLQCRLPHKFGEQDQSVVEKHLSALLHKRWVGQRVHVRIDQVVDRQRAGWWTGGGRGPTAADAGIVSGCGTISYACTQWGCPRRQRGGCPRCARMRYRGSISGSGGDGICGGGGGGSAASASPPVRRRTAATSAAAAGTSTVWSPSLKGYVNRALAQCGASDTSCNQMEEALKDKITALQSAGRMESTDWEREPLPSAGPHQDSCPPESAGRGAEIPGSTSVKKAPTRAGVGAAKKTPLPRCACGSNAERGCPSSRCGACCNMSGCPRHRRQSDKSTQ